jgi:precorrin-6B methylase 2
MMPKKSKRPRDAAQKMLEAEEEKKVEPCDAGATSAAGGALELVKRAYARIDGYSIARESKKRQRAENIFLDGITYGEVQADGFLTALAWCDPKPGETFIDMGSGTGIAVLTAAASVALKSAIGVEIVQSLHDAALTALGSCRGKLITNDVQFVCADALTYDWQQHDLVFCSLTCFTDEQADAVRQGAEKLRKGSRMLVTSRTLDSTSMRLLRRQDLPYGKGRMTFLAYERV